LLGLTNRRKQTEVAQLVAKKSISVRETEALVRRMADGGRPARSPDSDEGSRDPNIRRLEEELAEKLGAKVAIEPGRNGKGRLVVTYNTLDELDGILAHIQ
jgi:ParB family chromosome partitioning protein